MNENAFEQGSGFLDGVYAFFSSLGFGNSQFKYESDSDAEDSQVCL